MSLLSTTVGYANNRTGFVPRGIFLGALQTRWAGHRLFVVGNYSHYLSVVPALRSRPPLSFAQIKDFFLERRCEASIRRCLRLRPPHLPPRAASHQNLANP